MEYKTINAILQGLTELTEAMNGISREIKNLSFNSSIITKNVKPSPVQETVKEGASEVIDPVSESDDQGSETASDIPTPMKSGDREIDVDEGSDKVL